MHILINSVNGSIELRKLAGDKYFVINIMTTDLNSVHQMSIAVVLSITLLEDEIYLTIENKKVQK